MTQRQSVTRWLAFGLILSLVGLLSHDIASAQTPLAATQQRAEEGDAAAQYNLGVSYEYELGVPQDGALALAWFRQAADEGDVAAQYHLGAMYARGGEATGGPRTGGGILRYR